MRIEGKICTLHKRAVCVAEALRVDNLAGMHTAATGNAVATAISSPVLRTVIASVDDYLMNLSIAEELCSFDSA
jgi:hypothetical protein